MMTVLLIAAAYLLIGYTTDRFVRVWHEIDVVLDALDGDPDA